MRQGTVFTRITILMIFLACLSWLGWSAWRTVSTPFRLVTLYESTVSEGVETTGWLVREERVLVAQHAATTDQLFAQGEKVGAGQTVVALYPNQDALERKQVIRTLSMELELLDLSLRQEENTLAGDAEPDREIRTAMAALRHDMAHRDFSRLEDAVLDLKRLVFQREYVYQEVDTAAAQQRAQALRAEISALRTAAQQEEASVIAPEGGVFSGQVDGYETALTPAALDGLTVAGFTALTARPPQPAANAVGKLITNARWYFAALLPQSAVALSPGQRITAAFSRDYYGDVSMRVESVSQAVNGQVAVVLSATRALAETSLLRRQTVELVTARHTGIRIPKTALRVAVTPAETAGASDLRTTGVYTLVGTTAEWKPVTILFEGEDYYLVAPADGAGRRILRAGDSAVLSSRELYDGKVVR